MPPSSSVTRVSVCDAFFMSSLPTSVEPVKLIFFTWLLCVNANPISAELPVTTLITPFGIPALMDSSIMASAVKGVLLSGFTTQVHPLASAGATFRISIAAGKFHGVIIPTTPMGCFKMKILVSGKGEGKIFSSFEEVKIAYDARCIDLHAKIKVLFKNNIIETTVGRVILNAVFLSI